jgi:hypothetical protein
MKRTTPSQEVTHFDIGWLAGIIDGEGSLAHYYCVRNKNPNLKKCPIYGVYVINSDMEIMNKVKQIYDKIGVFAQIYLKSANKKQRENSYSFSKPCYEMVVRRRLDVEKLLKIIIPYLIGYKKQKANDMLNFFSKNPFNAKRQLRV